MYLKFRVKNLWAACLSVCGIMKNERSVAANADLVCRLRAPRNPSPAWLFPAPSKIALRSARNY